MGEHTREDAAERRDQPLASSSHAEEADERSFAVLTYLKLLGQAGEHFNRKLQRDYQVSQSQLACLKMLHQDGSMPISRLAKGLFVEPSTVTGVVDRLEHKGLVKRTRQGTDRRVVTIELTDTGQELAANAPSSIPRFLRKGMRELSEPEASTIVDALAKLVEMLNKHRTLP